MSTKVRHLQNIRVDKRYVSTQVRRRQNIGDNKYWRPQKLGIDKTLASNRPSAANISIFFIRINALVVLLAILQHYIGSRKSVKYDSWCCLFADPCLFVKLTCFHQYIGPPVYRSCIALFYRKRLPQQQRDRRIGERETSMH